jgi:membrane protein
MPGKLAITWYLSRTEMGLTYGAATSIVILLIWVYYSSNILYFGAEFTQAYAEKLGGKIFPKKNAISVNLKT